MSLLLPLYLLGLAGLALPWALHRFSNQVPEERAFPSIRFLEPTRPPVSRKRRLRYRVLFAARWLALLVLCLLFAEPWLSRLGALGDARRLHVIALDTSLSMQTADRWQQARDLARQQIADVPEGDLVRLLTFDTSVTSHGEASQVHADAMSTLNTLTPGFGASDYGVLMQWLDNGAEEAELPVQVTVITDAQRAGLPDRINALTASRLESLDIVDVSVPGQTNVSLSADVRTLDDVTARVSVSVRASRSGSTSQADPGRFDRTVVVSHGDRELARQSISLSESDRENLLFESIPLPSVANPVFRIALQESDELSVDDQIEAVVRQPEALSVALGAFSGNVDVNAAAFVSTALQTDGEAEVDATGSALSNLANQNRHAVIFTDLAELDELPEELARFLDVGGNALLVNRVDRGTETVADTGEAAPVTTIGRLDDSHPLALGNIDWRGVRFHTLPEIDLNEEDRVLIETTGRVPVLIERPVARGSLLMLNDTLEGEESNLPVHPGFVAMMRRILAEFARNAAIPEQVVVGDAVALPGNIQILDPTGNKLLELSALAEAQSFVFESPGLHTVLDSRGEHRLSAVLDPAESDLATLDAVDIEAWESGGTRDPAADAPTAVEDDASPAADAGRPLAMPRPPLPGTESEQGVVLWPWLIPLLALLLMSESLMGNRRLTVRRDGS